MAPDFIIVPVKPNDNVFVASQESQVAIQFTKEANLRLSDENISYTIRVSPEGFVDMGRGKGWSVDETTGAITIRPNTLYKSMSYTIEITVVKSIRDQFGKIYTAESYNRFDFRTTGPPTGGVFSVSPKEGFEDET